MDRLLILDLDDTIFETKSIGTEAVKPLIEGLRSHLVKHYDQATVERIINDSWKYPFDQVSKKYSFHSSLLTQFVSLIEKTHFQLDIQSFEDFHLLAETKEKMMLATTGFHKLQRAKIEALQIEHHFQEIFIDDPSDPNRSYKKGIFQQILADTNIPREQILVIGDNPESELKAAHELGIPTVQMAKYGQPRASISNFYVSGYEELISILA